MSEPVSAVSASPPGRRAPGVLRRYGSRMLLAAFVGLAALKLADVVVGVAANSRQRHLLRLVPGSSLRHKSNEFDYVFRVNRLGLRGPDIPFSKPPGTFRIVVLGDSMVAGFGVSDEHLMTTHLQDQLAAPMRPDGAAPRTETNQFEVVNVARVGTSTIRELDLYEALGRRFQPDLIILAYYLGNDLAEVVQEKTSAEAAGWHPDGRLRRVAYFWCPNLYLELAMIRQHRRQRSEFTKRPESQIVDELRSEARSRRRDPDAALAKYHSLPPNIRAAVASGLLSEMRIFDSCIEPDRLERALDPDADEFVRAWGRTAEQLERLRKAALRDGAGLAVVVIPASCQIDRRSLEAERAMGFNVHEVWLTEQPGTARALEDWSRDAGVPFLDLTDLFRRAGKPLYFLEDCHLNPDGNAVAAKAICDFILTRGRSP